MQFQPKDVSSVPPDFDWDGLLRPKNQEPVSPSANRYSVRCFNPEMGEAGARLCAEMIIAGSPIFDAPLQNSEGRTVYVSMPPELTNLPEGVDCLKLKGARLCKMENGRLLLREPNHLAVYASNGFKPGHLALAKDLGSSITPARKSFAGSLNEAGALTEYGASRLASLRQVAFPPLFVTRLKHDSREIKNGAGENVAVACLGHNMAYRKVVALFPVAIPLKVAQTLRRDARGNIDLENNCLYTGPDSESAPFCSTIELASKVGETMGAIGKAKRILYRDCHIARHVGHRGNVWKNLLTNDIKFTDFDSVLILGDQTQKEWGAQLLRDLFTESIRIATDTILNFNVHHDGQLQFGLNAALPSFLRQMFPSMQAHLKDSKLIDDMLGRLTLSAHSQILGAKEAIVLRKPIGRLIPAMCAFASASQPLLETLYTLIAEDNELKSAGYALIGLTQEQRRVKFDAIIQHYQESLQPPDHIVAHFALRRRA